MSDETEDTAALLDISEVDRVIDEENTKTFQVKTTILYLDDKASGERYEGAEVDFENPITVYNDSGDEIGVATLSVDGKRVDAELFLDYHIPERLTIETKSTKLYAHYTALEAMDTSEMPWRVAYSRISSIQITHDIPPDDRIDPL